MSEALRESPLEQIDRRLEALAAAEKRLKKPSTLSFVERRELSAKASHAAAELRARREELEAGENAAPAEGEDETQALPEPLRAALAEADRVLDRLDGGSSGFQRPGAPARKLPGQQRRGAAGASQTRPPDRVGE